MNQTTQNKTITNNLPVPQNITFFKTSDKKKINLQSPGAVPVFLFTYFHVFYMNGELWFDDNKHGVK